MAVRKELNKREVLDAFIEKVEADLASVTESQKESASDAVHEESRAEDAKDTRAIETSYLARGLAKRVTELRTTLAALVSLELRTFAEDVPANVSAMVCIEDNADVISTYLIVPEGGGLRVTLGKSTVIAVTPRSPLGKALMGKREDDDVRIATPGGLRESCVISVR